MARIFFPTPLKGRDIVEIIAISSPVDSDLLDKGAEFLMSKGFEVRVGPRVYERKDYLAGDDATRASELNRSIKDPDVAGIIFARGGYGSMRILDMIEPGPLLRLPKIFMGMSDLTALALSLYKRVGIVTFSGPVAAGQLASGLDDLSRSFFLNALNVDLLNVNFWVEGEKEIGIQRGGAARGNLLGGCLSLVRSLVGTGHLPDMKGAVLLLEDVNEPLYKLDRMLMHLKLSGILDNAAGFVLGYFLGPNSEDLSPEVAQILADLCPESKSPIIYNYPHGHRLPNITLAHGCPMELDTYSKRFMCLKA